MNYFNFVKAIESVSMQHQLVEEWKEGDVYDNFNSGQHRYGAINMTVQSVVDVNPSLSKVNFVLFYMDRLLDDNSNKIEIQSVALTVLKQIINRLEDTYNISFSNMTYTPFSEKLADMVAGMYLSASISIESDVLCADDIYVG